MYQKNNHSINCLLLFTALACFLLDVTMAFPTISYSYTSSISNNKHRDHQKVELWWQQAIKVFRIQKIIVINLERRKDRRNIIEQDYNSIASLSTTPLEFLNATDNTDPIVEIALANVPLEKKSEDVNKQNKGNASKLSSVVATYFSWERALILAVNTNQFPILIAEDDLALAAPAFESMPENKTWPNDTILISFASFSASDGNVDTGDTTSNKDWFTVPKSGDWGIAGLYFPSIEGCRVALEFMRRFNTAYHADLVLLRGLSAANGGKGVYIASPPMLHWHASYSDVYGAYRTSSRSKNSNNKMFNCTFRDSDDTPSKIGLIQCLEEEEEEKEVSV
jgi:hypothetical protein